MSAPDRDAATPVSVQSLALVNGLRRVKTGSDDEVALLAAGYSIVERDGMDTTLQRARRTSDRTTYTTRDGRVTVQGLHRDQVAAAARAAERYGADLGPLGLDVVARIVAELRTWEERRATEERALARRNEQADIERRVGIHRARTIVSGSKR